MVRGTYIVQPDYDDDDFNRLGDFAGSHKVDYAGYITLTPMPGAPLYKEMYDEIIDHDLKKFNFFNSVLKTKLPLDKFYRKVGDLWTIKRGQDVL